MSKFIYMDNAATTAVRQEVVDAMVPYFTESYANPSSVYSFAQKTKNDMEEARETIASILGAAKPNEIYFTGGGSESDNWALKAAAEAFKSRVITLLQLRLNIMQFFILANGLKSTDMK